MPEDQKILNQLLQVTSSVDAEIKNLIRQNQAVCERLEAMTNIQTNLMTRLSVVEVQQKSVDGDITNLKTGVSQITTSLTAISTKLERLGNNWDKVVDNMFKIFIMILGVYLTFILSSPIIISERNANHDTAAVQSRGP